MAALDDFRGAVIEPNALNEGAIGPRNALGDEDVIGAPEIGGRFAQGAPRKEELVAKRSLAIDQANLQAMLDVEILHAVVEDEGVDAHVPNRMDGTFDPVFIDQ